MGVLAMGCLCQRLEQLVAALSPFCCNFWNCQRLERLVGAEECDYELANLTWKVAFGTPRRMWCCLGPKSYLLLRVSLLLIWLYVVAKDTVLNPEWEGLYWFIYLTHWGACVLLAYLALAAVSTYMAIYSGLPDGKGEETPRFIRLTWFLGSMVAVACFMITFLYWTLVYKEGDEITWVTKMLHGGNLLVALLDVAVSRQPYYVSHVLSSMLFGISYITFSYVYHKAGGTTKDGDPFIYEALNWADAADEARNLSAVIVLLGIPLIYTGVFLLATAYKCCGCLCVPAPPKWHELLSPRDQP